MKKILLFGILFAALGVVSAQTPSTPVPPPAEQQSNAKIKFDELAHSFGNIIEGELARYEFKFTNTGTEPLVLTNVQASCGCTTPKWPREPIAPGQTAVISAEYNSNGRPGSFTKNIFVHSNGGEVTLTISGLVIKEPERPKSPIIIKG